MKKNYLFILVCIVTVKLLGFPVFLNAETVVVNNPEFSMVDLEERSEGVLPKTALVTSNGSVTIQPPSADPAIWSKVNGWNLNLDQGSVLTSSSYGILFRSSLDDSGDLKKGGIFNSGTVVVNGDNNSTGILIGKKSTVANSGTIAVKGDRSIGVLMGKKGKFTNSGTMAIEGNRSLGVLMGRKSNFTNSGNVAVQGDRSFGILMGRRGNFTNSGTVAVDGDTSFGVLMGKKSNFTNSGTIAVNGSLGYGVLMGKKSNFTNSGTITVEAKKAVGILFGALTGKKSDVTNTGTIAVDAHKGLGVGILLGKNNRLYNSGTIIGDIGIIGGKNLFLTNSGIITGKKGVAIMMNGGDNTVILNTGSVINGNIVAGDGRGNDSIELNGAGTINGNQIQEFENLGKTGNGIWILSGDMNYKNMAMTIASGTLAFGGNVKTGTYTQNQGGALGLIVTPDASGKLTVKNNADLNNGSFIVMPQPGKYGKTTDYGKVFKADPINGAFGSISSSSAFLSPVLTRGKNNYSLVLNRQDFATGGNTPNGKNIGTALDRAYDSATGDMRKILDNLVALSPSNVRHAFDQLSGLSHASLTGASLVSINQYLGTMAARMGGFISGSASGNTGPGAFQGTMLAQRMDTVTDAGGGILALGTAINRTQDKTRWGFWVQGYGNLGQKTGDESSSKYHYSVLGTIFGFDKKINANLLLGTSVGYSYTKVDMDDIASPANVTSYQGSVYGAYFAEPWYVNGLASYGYNRYDTSRDISFAGVTSTRTAEAQYAGNALSGYIETGYRYKVNAVSIIPMLSLQGSYLMRDSFTENGAGALNLDVDKDHTSSLLGSMGGKIRKDYETPSGTITPEFRAKWLHDFSNDDYMVNAGFAGSPLATFTVQADKPRKDSVVLGVGLTRTTKENMSIFISYDANLADDRTEHAAAVMLRYRW